MKTTDETLSAFLDAELPEHEMEVVRLRLLEDQKLSNRLAEMSAVDPMLASHYAGIDERPLPESIHRLLSEEKPVRGKVIGFPAWRRATQRFHQQLQQHAGLAAAITLAIGLGLGQVLSSGSADTDWSAIADGLESTPSGTTMELAKDQQLTPRLTFLNQQGQYCRQFRLVADAKASENIACRDADNESNTSSWQLAASVQLNAMERPGSYQTASGGSILDAALDQMMNGDAFDADAENKLIVANWKQQP